MIFQLTNPLLIPEVVKLGAAVPETDLEVLKRAMISGIGRRDARIFVYEKDNEFKAFIFATMEEFECEDAVFIQFCVIVPMTNDRDIGMELLNKVREWGSAAGAKWIYTMTDRNPKAFSRKYKFRYHKTVLKRSI